MEPVFNIILVTAKDKAEAHGLSTALLESKLIACANIISAVESFYWWEGKIERSAEALLVLKAKAEDFEAIRQLIKEKHSYETPEIIAVPIKQGDQDYLQWLSRSVER